MPRIETKGIFSKGYGLLPFLPLRDHRLTQLDKLVLAILWGFFAPRGKAEISATSLSTILSCSRRAIEKSKARLIELGYIEVANEKGRTSVILPNYFPTVPQVGTPPNVGTQTPEPGFTPSETYSENKIDIQPSAEPIEIIPEEDTLPRKKFIKKQAIEEGYKGHLTNPILEWAEERVGHPLLPMIKQKSAIKAILIAGFTSEQIKECWIGLEQDEYWSEKGMDFMTVFNQISKVKKTKKVSQVISKSANW